jgi:hypothetical protein
LRSLNLGLRGCYTGLPPRKTSTSFSTNASPRKSQARQARQSSLMQAQGSQQVSLRAPRPIPGSAGSVRGFAGVAQLVEHLFCKQVVSGSIPLASSGAGALGTPKFVKASEGCPSGQREQAVNLPAHAYVGSNPTPSTSLRGSAPPQAELGAPPAVLGPQPQNQRRGMTRQGPGFDPAAGGFAPASRALLVSAGVTQLVESQFSKLKVDGSSPFSRSNDKVSFDRLSENVSAISSFKQARPASLRAGEAEASTGAERTPVREHRSAAEAQPACKIAGRPFGRVSATRNAHLAQMVEHVLGKDEVTSSILVVGSNSVQP